MRCVPVMRARFSLSHSLRAARLRAPQHGTHASTIYAVPTSHTHAGVRATHGDVRITSHSRWLRRPAQYESSPAQQPNCPNARKARCTDQCATASYHVPSSSLLASTLGSRSHTLSHSTHVLFRQHKPRSMHATLWRPIMYQSGPTANTKVCAHALGEAWCGRAHDGTPAPLATADSRRSRAGV